MSTNWGDESTDSEDDYLPLPIPGLAPKQPDPPAPVVSSPPQVTRQTQRVSQQKEVIRQQPPPKRQGNRKLGRDSYNLTDRHDPNQPHPNQCPQGSDPYTMVLSGLPDEESVRNMLLDEYIRHDKFLPSIEKQGEGQWLLTFKSWRTLANTYARIPRDSTPDYSLTVEDEHNLSVLESFFNPSPSTPSHPASAATQLSYAGSSSSSSSFAGSGRRGQQRGRSDGDDNVEVHNLTSGRGGRHSGNHGGYIPTPQRLQTPLPTQDADLLDFQAGQTIVLTAENPFGDVRSREEILEERKKKEQLEREKAQQQQQQQHQQRHAKSHRGGDKSNRLHETSKQIYSFRDPENKLYNNKPAHHRGGGDVDPSRSGAQRPPDSPFAGRSFGRGRRTNPTSTRGFSSTSSTTADTEGTAPEFDLDQPPPSVIAGTPVSATTVYDNDPSASTTRGKERDSTRHQHRKQYQHQHQHQNQEKRGPGGSASAPASGGGKSPHLSQSFSNKKRRSQTRSAESDVDDIDRKLEELEKQRSASSRASQTASTSPTPKADRTSSNPFEVLAD